MYEPSHYILMIDDDEDDLEMLCSLLELCGIKTKRFLSCRKAIFYLNLMSDISELPVLIICDYNMPIMNGQQFLTLIKSIKTTKEIPVVIYSTGMSPALKTTLTEAGAFDCLSKASTCLQLVEQVAIFKELVSSLKSKQMIQEKFSSGLPSA